MARCTTLFLDAVARLGDDDFDAPTDLPGWTRAHLVAHVHHNAVALRRLTRWAATGVEHPMYESAGQRGAEIASSATLPPSTLRHLVRHSASLLAEDLDALPDEAWRREVVTAQGRVVPATEIPWLRVREVGVHAVDLGTGCRFEDLPDDMVSALLLDVVGRRAALGEGAALAAWLTGRSTTAPDLAPWL